MIVPLLPPTWIGGNETAVGALVWKEVSYTCIINLRLVTKATAGPGNFKLPVPSGITSVVPPGALELVEPIGVWPLSI